MIDSLSLTLDTDAGTIKKFDIFQRKSNISAYERADTISPLKHFSRERRAGHRTICDGGNDETGTQDDHD